MAQAIKENNNYQKTFRHGTSIGEHGETLYDAPIIIESDEDLKCYGITEKDCRTIRFGSSDPTRVWFFKTDNLQFANEQWAMMDTRHSRGYATARCMVRGKQKAYILCPDTIKCAQCPWGIKPEDKQGRTISWDRLIESGYAPAMGIPVEKQVLDKIEMEEFEQIMNAEDPRIWMAFAMKRFENETVKEISRMIKVSEPRVYQLLDKAYRIIRQNRELDD